METLNVLLSTEEKKEENDEGQIVETKPSEQADDQADEVDVSEEGLEAMWVDEEVVVGGSSNSPVAPSSVQKARTPFGFARQRSNKAGVRLLENENSSTTIEREPSPKMDAIADSTTTSPSTQDLSTLGFDNTFDDNNSPNAMSMSSLNEILDGSVSSPDSTKCSTGAGDSPASKASPSEEDKPEVKKKKTRAEKKSPTSPSEKKKSFFGRFSSRSVPAQNNTSDTDGAVATVVEKDDDPLVILGGTKSSPTKSTPTKSPSRATRKNNNVERFVATVVEKDPEATDENPTFKPEDTTASEVEDKVLQHIQAAMMEDDTESVTSMDGVKKFLTMNPPTQRPADGSEEKKKNPTTTTTSTSVLSFISAPKGISPQLLMQKSWDSLLSNEAAREQDAPQIITSVPSLEMSDDDEDNANQNKDSRGDKYSVQESESKDKYSAVDDLDAEKEKETSDESLSRELPALNDDNDIVSPSETTKDSSPKGGDTLDAVETSKSTSTSNKDASAKKGSGFFASFGRGKKESSSNLEANKKQTEKDKKSKNGSNVKAAKDEVETLDKPTVESMGKVQKTKEPKKNKKENAKEEATSSKPEKKPVERRKKMKSSRMGGESRGLSGLFGKLRNQKKQEAEKKEEAEPITVKLFCGPDLKRVDPSKKRSELNGGATAADNQSQTEVEEETDVTPIQVQLYYGETLKRVDKSKIRSDVVPQTNTQTTATFSADDEEDDKPEEQNEDPLIQQIKSQSMKAQRNGVDPPVPSQERNPVRAALDP